VDDLEAKGVNQKVVDGIDNLGVVDRVHRRLKDGNGNILIGALDGCAEEGEDPMRGVLLLERLQRMKPMGTSGIGSIGLLDIIMSTIACSSMVDN
jgi:hypothetical protein